MDLKKDKISKLKLKEINPQQILPYKNKLFVTHCDLTSGMGKAISLLNPQTGESKVYKFKHNVIQCQTKEDYLYILSNDSIYKYKFDGEKMHLEASSKIAIKGSWKNGYISSLFSEIVTPVLTSNHRLHIIKPIEIVGNTKYQRKRSITRIEMLSIRLFYY